MRKHNKTLKAVAFVLLVTLIALILVSSTYAKYTTEYSGTDTAIVAKFSVGADNVESFDLFNTIYDSDGTTEETDVDSDLIAPGTSGLFEIELENSSEVTVEYTLSLSETNDSGVPIVYSTDGTNYYSMDELGSVTGTLEIGSTTTTTKSVTVYWKWEYYESDDQDTEDTTIGESTEDVEFEVTATAVFTHVD